jgi:hypothetical protein
MSVPIYLDHNVNPRVAAALRRHGVDCLTAYEDGSATLRDEPLLDRVLTLGRVLYTQDSDFLEIGARWQREGRTFAGIAYAQQGRLSIGELIEQLLLIGLASNPDDWQDTIRYLPL